MKKTVVILLVMVLLAFTGCTSEAPSGGTDVKDVETVDYSLVYADLLQRYYDGITEKDDDILCQEGFSAVCETLYMRDVSEALAFTGYAIKDLNGDGVDELIIGEPTEVKDNYRYVGMTIDAVYTCIDETPTLVFEGWARNYYYYLGNAKFGNFGSAGAASSSLGTFELVPGKDELVCQDFYFSEPKDDDFYEVVYYHNDLGLWNVDYSESLDMTEEEFTSMAREQESHAQEMEFTPFIHFTNSEIKVDFIRDHVNPEGGYEAITLHPEMSSYPTGLFFSAGHAVKDFKIMDLELTDVDSQGNPIFKEEVQAEYDVIDPEHPLVVYAHFLGDMPNLGISFTDINGKTRKYSVSESGYDGSMVLSEYK